MLEGLLKLHQEQLSSASHPKLSHVRRKVIVIHRVAPGCWKLLVGGAPHEKAHYIRLIAQATSQQTL